MKLKILKTTQPTADSVSLHFEKPPTLSYRAGQHGIFAFTVNGEQLRRPYSFSSSPTLDDELAITVRKINDGIVSSHLLKNTTLEAVDLEQVSGDFHIEPNSENRRHLVMLAGGSGITPIISMIRTILHAETQSSVSLVYINKCFERIIYRKELDTLVSETPGRFNVFHILTQESPIPNDYPVFYRERPSKLVMKKLIKSIIHDITCRAEYYMCGPHGLMQLFDDTLQTLNIDRAKIYREHFYIPSDVNKNLDIMNLPPREIIVHYHEEEKLLTVDGGESVLEAALSNGLRLPHSCTQGQCGVCRAVLVNGQVHLRKNYILDQSELDARQILLCQSFPLTDDVVVKPIN